MSETWEDISYSAERSGLEVYIPTSFSTVRNTYPTHKIKGEISTRSQRWQYTNRRHLSSCKTVLKRSLLRLHFPNSTKQNTTHMTHRAQQTACALLSIYMRFYLFNCFVFTMFYVMYCNVLILRYIGYTVRSYVICNSVLAVHIM